MEKVEIENEILKHFYGCWEMRADCSLTKVYQKLDQIGRKVIEKVGDDLERSGFIKGLLNSAYGELTAHGIIEAEKRGVVPIERLLRNEEVRFRILEFAAPFYGEDDPVDDDDIMSAHRISEKEYGSNFDFLENCGFVVSDAVRTFYIQQSGVKQFEIWRKRRCFREEFENLKNLTDMTAQQRGTKLEQLISDLLEFAGWKQEKNVTTIYEQIDVVIHLDREFYLIECKWEKNPIEAETIDKLFGKLSRRAGTNGILISVSGFTKGSIECVKDFTNQKLILLFGSKDLERIIVNPNTFEEILNHKYKELVMRRNVECE